MLVCAKMDHLGMNGAVSVLVLSQFGLLKPGLKVTPWNSG